MRSIEPGRRSFLIESEALGRLIKRPCKLCHADNIGTSRDRGVLLPFRMGSNDRRIDGNQEK